MKSISVCIIALALLAPSAVLAVGKYDREKICLKEKDNFSVCNLLVEQAVAKDIPGVIERKGAVLRIHLRNGKIVKRKNVRTASDCDVCYELSACGFLPDRGYLEICYSGWDSGGVELVNIKSGASFGPVGSPSYSPSGRRVLMVKWSDDGFTGVEIWRFDSKIPVKEFRMERSFNEDNQIEDSSKEDEEVSLWANLEWFHAVWKSETEIQVNGSSDSPLSSYHLVKKGHKWIFKKK